PHDHYRAVRHTSGPPCSRTPGGSARSPLSSPGLKRGLTGPVLQSREGDGLTRGSVTGPQGEIRGSISHQRDQGCPSSPALASSPPKYPPVPPAPMTTRRICFLLQKDVAAIFSFPLTKYTP